MRGAGAGSRRTPADGTSLDRVLADPAPDDKRRLLYCCATLAKSSMLSILRLLRPSVPPALPVALGLQPPPRLRASASLVALLAAEFVAPGLAPRDARAPVSVVA